MTVVGAQQQISVPYQDGRTFGSTGPATLTRLKLEHAVDPHHQANRSIVDLDLAERDGAGLVHSTMT
ncbi:MAG: hypothetical protein R2749_16170 [Acidimicrobiales bacterium]